MLYAHNKIKSLLQYNNNLLKIVFLMVIAIHSVFLNVVNAQTDEGGNSDTYFLDTDRFEKPVDSDESIIYTEKEDNNNKWIFIPIRSSMDGYRKAVANVVAAEFHRRLDMHLLVPDTKFLIKKGEHNDGYKLLGSVYKKFSSTKPIQEIMKKREFNKRGDVVYRNYNVEHTIAMWKYLGLPIAPSIADLELLEDNILIRYDYYNSFQYDSEIHETCFCTYNSKISDYKCDLDIIKRYVQDLQSKSNKETLEKIISEIKVDSTKYLIKEDSYAVGKELKHISSRF